MSSRRDELLAKKARLAELKRQREEWQQQFAAGRQGRRAEVRQSFLPT
jgi:lipase chaperone LimK